MSFLGQYLDYPEAKRTEKRKGNKKFSVVSTAYPYYKDLLVNFELAQVKAFIEVFGVVPHGYCFHFIQCQEETEEDA